MQKRDKFGRFLKGKVVKKKSKKIKSKVTVSAPKRLKVADLSILDLQQMIADEIELHSKGFW